MSKKEENKTNITMEETPKDNFGNGFNYVLREPFERMTSEGALSLEKIPGIERRFVNPEARRKTGRDKLYQLEENAEAKKIGDLYPAYAPTDLVLKQRRLNHAKGTGKLKKEQERRRELAEKMFYESNGNIRMQESFNGKMFGSEKPNYKKPGKTKYYYGR